MTEKQLKNVLHKWQKKLRLMDWDIDIQYVPEEELDDYVFACGDVYYTLETRKALIRVLRQDQIPVDMYGNQVHTVESTIVHELLHLVFGPAVLSYPLGYKTEGPNYAEEQGINMLTELLMAGVKHETN